MVRLAFLLISTMLVACGGSLPDRLPSSEQIDKTIAKGEYTEAAKLIRLYLTNDSLTEQKRYEMNFKLLKMDRIRLDFKAQDTTVISYIKKYYPEVTKQQIEEWEKSNALENITIDGQKRYFRNAGRNLFRIDSLAAKHFPDPDGPQGDTLRRLLTKHLPKVVQAAKNSNSACVMPVKMKVTYTITVKAGQVPAGEVIRVWMPYPRTDEKSQTDVKLISASQPEYLISPDTYAHKSIYMEGLAKAGKPTKFSIELSYTSYNRYFNFKPEDLKPYNTNDPLYKKYTSQEAPHILFSDTIKSLAKKIVGTETNPYMKVRKIWEWVDKNFPWASAREYSTIDNIPEYVLANRHGDCGQVSLLFITLARCAGVPAKWQSGWMMHPGDVNLHDWAEVYYQGIGWVPVDQSFGRITQLKDNADAFAFFSKGLDCYRMIVNEDISRPFFPAKIYPRSETVDFQRGEVEWKGGNLYFDKWNYDMEVSYQ